MAARTSPAPGLTEARWASVRRAAEVAAKAAADVDDKARFPEEAVRALREGGLLAAAAPPGLGGQGLTTDDLTRIAEHLAAACGATAMVWAMHQIQLACLVNHHPGSPMLEQAAADQWLIASVTSEAGVGGDLRQSRAALTRTADGDFALLKHAPTISYGEHAQAFFVTARRAPDALAVAQVAVLAEADRVRLVRTGEWNTLGMRGTCSPAFDLETTVAEAQVVPTPFSEIASRTMVPLAHLLWASVWVGLAGEAVRRAAAFCRARNRTGAAPGNPVLAHAHAKLAGLRGQLAAATAAAAPVLENGEDPSMALTVQVNALKVNVSETAVEIARLALEVCGMAGYSENGPYSVARILRDLLSAPLMISNNRLLVTNAALVPALRGAR